MKLITKKLVAALGSLVVLLSVLPFSVFAITENITEPNNKIDEKILAEFGINDTKGLSGGEILEEIKSVDSKKKVPVVLWIEDSVSMEKAQEQGFKVSGLSIKDGIASDSTSGDRSEDRDGIKTEELNHELSISGEKVDAFIMAKRQSAREQYLEQNKKYVEENMGDMTILYISEYSPVILAEVNVKEVYQLAEKSSCDTIYLYEDKIEDCASTEDGTKMVKANIPRDTYAYKGNGVKIGQYESNTPQSGFGIYHVNSKAESNGHAYRVFSIMKNIAPEATYYFNSWYRSDNTISDNHYKNIEWFLTAGVNIINQSTNWGGDADNKYGSVARWLDHIAFNHDVHFIKASGNLNTQNSGVTSGGMAYNIITVGAVNYATSNPQFPSYSLYNTTSAFGYKPDIAACGDGVSGSGTSYAAAQVTGVVAQLCSQNAALKTKQHAVKAILTATTRSDSGWRRTTTGTTMFRQTGAGILDANMARWAVAGNRFSATYHLSGNASKTTNISVASTDTMMRISVCHAYYMSFPGTNHEYDLAAATIGRVRVTVTRANGTTQTYYSGTGNVHNVTVLDVPVNGSYGTWKVTVKAEVAGTGGVYYALAWR